MKGFPLGFPIGVYSACILWTLCATLNLGIQMWSKQNCQALICLQCAIINCWFCTECRHVTGVAASVIRECEILLSALHSSFSDGILRCIAPYMKTSIERLWQTDHSCYIVINVYCSNELVFHESTESWRKRMR